METPGDGDGGQAKTGDEDNTEVALVQRLRDGDESAFVEIVEAYQVPLRRFLRNYVPSEDVAEDIAQETWVAVLRGLESFEGRSALKTWIFRIGAFRAQSRMKRERRIVPFASLRRSSGEDDDIDIDRLMPAEFSRDTGMWMSPPRRWDEEPETKLLSDETVRFVHKTIQQLPPMQASVITLRDIEKWTAAEVREALDLSEANQRVLLHRARLKVRKALEMRAGEGGEA
jgi:RNA polymerase sigma-70 factor, ECF subfamily